MKLYRQELISSLESMGVATSMYIGFIYKPSILFHSPRMFWGKLSGPQIGRAER
jgi:hypothetical protein